MTTESTFRTRLPSQSARGRGVIGVVVVTVALHMVAYVALWAIRSPAPTARSSQDEPVYLPRPAERYLVKVAPRPQAKPPVAKPPTPRRKLERLVRKPARRTRLPRARPTPRATKQLARTPQTLDLTGQPRAGVNASLTAPGGEAAYTVGSSAQGDPAAPTGRRIPAKEGTVPTAPARTPTIAPAPPPLQVKRLPRVLRVPRVAYPRVARAKRIQGTVKLRVTVGKNGRVLRVKVLKGLGHGLDGAALSALRKARFEPAVSTEGRRMTYTIRYRYRFRLEE